PIGNIKTRFFTKRLDAADDFPRRSFAAERVVDLCIECYGCSILRRYQPAFDVFARYLYILCLNCVVRTINCKVNATGCFESSYLSCVHCTDKRGYLLGLFAELPTENLEIWFY